MADQFMSELVCSGCGRTAHITWEGTGVARRPVEVSENIRHLPGPPPTFSCIAPALRNSTWNGRIMRDMSVSEKAYNKPRMSRCDIDSDWTSKTKGASVGHAQ
jgi:hypothetical protein